MSLNLKISKIENLEIETKQIIRNCYSILEDKYTVVDMLSKKNSKRPFYAQWSDYIRFYKYSLLTLDSAMKLLELKRYVDAFCLIRRAFENFLIFKTFGKEKILVFSYFDFMNYEPEFARIDKLKIFRNNDFDDELIKGARTSEHCQIQKKLNLGKIIENNFNEKNDYIMVHYNFLSQFSHPSKYSLKIYDMNYIDYKIDQFNAPRYNENVQILICLYCLYFSKYYVKELHRKLWRYFKINKDTINNIESISSNYPFWFLYEKPTSIDRWQNKVIKWYQKSINKKTLNRKIAYYKDPLDWVGYNKTCFI